MKKAIVFLIMTMIFTACGGGGKKSDSPAETSGEVLRVYSDAQERTPGGALIASRRGVSSEMKDLADESLSGVFADAAALGYTQNLNHGDYIIYVLDNCTPSPEQRVPSFRLRADDYDNTPFDQDPRPGIGYILASEFVIQDGGFVTNEFVICDDAANARQNFRYGPEHIILARNNPAEYERTKFHGGGVSHPIIAGRNNAIQHDEEKQNVVGASGAATGRINQK